MIGHIAYHDFPVKYTDENGKATRYPKESTTESEKNTKRHFDIKITDDKGKPYMVPILDPSGRPIRVPVMEHVLDADDDWVVDVPEDAVIDDINDFPWKYEQVKDEKGNPVFEDLLEPDERFKDQRFSFGPEFVKYIKGLKDLAAKKGEKFTWDPIVFSNSKDEDEEEEDDKIYYNADDLARLKKIREKTEGPIFTDEGLNEELFKNLKELGEEDPFNISDDFYKPFDPTKSAIDAAKKSIWDTATKNAQEKRDKANEEINKRTFLAESEKTRAIKNAMDSIDREMFNTINKQLAELNIPKIEKQYPGTEPVEKKLKDDEPVDEYEYKKEQRKKDASFKDLYNLALKIVGQDSSLSTKEKNAKMKEIGRALAQHEEETLKENADRKRLNEGETVPFDPYRLFRSDLPSNKRKSEVLRNILNESMDFSPLLGDPLDERPMPYIYADLGTKADSSRFHKDKDGNFIPGDGVLDNKYRKKLYGWKYRNHPFVQWDIFRDNENSPFYNLNHPMWNMSEEEYDKWAKENPDLVTISPQYADYTGKLVRNEAGKLKAMDYDARDKRRLRRMGIVKGAPVLSKPEALAYLLGDDSISEKEADSIYESAQKKWGEKFSGDKNSDLYGMLAKATDEDGVLHPELLPRFTSMALIQNYPKHFDENGHLVIDLDRNIRDRNADGTIRKTRVYDPAKREQQVKNNYYKALLEDALETWALTPEQRKANFDPKTMEILARLDDEDAARIGEDKRTHHYIDPQWRIASKGEINSKRKSDINTLFNNNRNQNAENIEFLEKHGIPIDQDARTFARQIMDYDTYKDIFLDPKNMSLKDRLRAMLEIIANSDKWNDYKPSGVSNSVISTLTNLHDGGRL